MSNKHISKLLLICLISSCLAFTPYKLPTYHKAKTPIRNLQDTTAPTVDPTSSSPTTAAPPVPTTAAPTTAAPPAPTTPAPTTAAPSTEVPTTALPTTQKPTTALPTTQKPTTQAPPPPTTPAPAPTTEAPTTQKPTTLAPTTQAPTTLKPTTAAPTTSSPTTAKPTTVSPTTITPTGNATSAPTVPPPATKIDHSSEISYKMGYQPEFTGILKYTWENCASESKDYGLTCQFFKSSPNINAYLVDSYEPINCEGNDVSVFNTTDILEIYAGCALLKLSHTNETANIVEEQFVIKANGIKVKTWEIVTIAGVGVVVLLLIICICYCCCKKGCCPCCKKNEDAIGVRPKKNKKNKNKKKRDRGAYAPLV